MSVRYKGTVIADVGGSGISGSDSNPIGTIISYMGLTAPKDYLICDGATYNIADYSKLAEFFKTQFGSENYFGGDGTTTFAVPDMRNLFLRGYHGESEKQLSDNIGVLQNGTSVPRLGLDGSHNSIFMSKVNNAYVLTSNGDEELDFTNLVSSVNVGSSTGASTVAAKMTVRPVNMAVLYCIKATMAESYENVYSTEETRIGTWIDGKPLYRKTFYLVTGPSIKYWYETGAVIPDCDVFVKIFGMLRKTNGDAISIPFPNVGTESVNIYYKFAASSTAGGFTVFVSASDYTDIPFYLTAEYTKTTDIATKAVVEPLSAMTHELPGYHTAAASVSSATLEADTLRNEEI